MTCIPSSRALLAAIIFLAGGLSVHAQTMTSTTDIPRTISYQGLLSSSDGTPFADGQYQVTVTLYSSEQGGGPVWQDNYTTQVTNGIFNLHLGTGSKGLPSPEIMNRPLWIGTSVNGAGEMRPLTPLTASPYAFNVPDQAITGNKIADGAITAAKLDIDYVSEIQIDGEKISSKGTVINLVGTPAVPLSYDEATQSVTIGRTEAGTSDKEKSASTLGTTFDFWTLRGNGRTDNGAIVVPVVGDWIGTGAASAANFDLRTGGTSIMRYKQAADPNIEGGNATAIAAAAVGSTISGGRTHLINGDYDVIAGGDANAINAGNTNTISGGLNNNIAPSGAAINSAVIGGGEVNFVDGTYSTVGGGYDNGIGNFPMSTIGGGANHRINAPEGTIAGGHHNAVNAYVGAITGGHDNIIGPAGMAGSIIGGRNNTVDADLGTIGGGMNNNIYPTNDKSFIGGGENNMIGVAGGMGGSMHATIGGGMVNTIHPTSNSAFLGGGENNMIGTPGGTGAPHAVLGGGQSNRVNAQFSTIGGGQGNTITAAAPMATIGGGAGHNVTAPEGTIAGGHNNRVEDYVGTVAGGHDNVIAPGGNAGFVGGGRMNNVSAASSAIMGGDNNMISGPYSSVAGGQNNSSPGTNNFVGSGQGNVANGSYNAIGSGQNNNVDGSYNFIGSGQNNTITAGAMIATIGGGGQHIITAPEATIAGGHVNRIDAYVGAIAGGHNNHVSPGAIASAIGGGRENVTMGENTTIPGGDRLLTDPSYAQTVVGFYNIPRGLAVPFRPTAAVIAATDGPLFMVGNGDANVAAGRSNAFEVSYNGHSTVFDINGSGTGRSAFNGATYADNVVYGWAEVDPAVAGLVVSDFGIASVTPGGAGIFNVTLNYLDPYTGSATLNNIVVTATLTNGHCGFISVTVPAGPGNTFIIETKDPACNHMDMPFMFHVTGRP